MQAYLEWHRQAAPGYSPQQYQRRQLAYGHAAQRSQPATSTAGTWAPRRAVDCPQSGPFLTPGDSQGLFSLVSLRSTPASPAGRPTTSPRELAAISNVEGGRCAKTEKARRSRCECLLHAILFSFLLGAIYLTTRVSVGWGNDCRLDYGAGGSHHFMQAVVGTCRDYKKSCRLEKGVDYNSDYIEKIPAIPSVQDCMKRCMDASPCTHFSWSGSFCYTKAGSPANRTTVAGATSGICSMAAQTVLAHTAMDAALPPPSPAALAPHPAPPLPAALPTAPSPPPPCSMEQAALYDDSSFEIVGSVRSAAQCAEMCRTTPTCTHFSWIGTLSQFKSYKNCYKKTGTPANRKMMPGTHSGICPGNAGAPPGGAAPAPGNATPAGGCDTLCVWKGHPESCKFRIQWAAKFSWKVNACKLAHDIVLGQCPMCSGCTLELADCRLPAAAVEHDCMNGYFNWKKTWSAEKKAWCCETKKLACETAAAPAIPAAPTTATTTPTTSTTATASATATRTLAATTTTVTSTPTTASPKPAPTSTTTKGMVVVNFTVEEPGAPQLPKLACSSRGCEAPFVGVNLGGWLLLEDWIWSSEMRDKDIKDEWTLIQKHGGPQDKRAISLMHRHWDTFVSEDDLDRLQDFGVTHVRIPIGWWLVDYDVADGYVNGGERFLFRMLLWLKKRNMRALLDLHAAPGGQVGGSSFTGKRSKDPMFFMSRASYKRGKQAMYRLAVLIAAYETDKRTAGVVMGMELLNEPQWDYWDSSPGIQELYGTMVPRVRELLPANRYVLFLSFQEKPGKVESSQWLAMMRRRDPRNFEGVVYDVHVYHSFGDDNMKGRKWRKDEDSCKTCCRDPALLHPIVHAGVPICIGEYSLNTGFGGNSKFFRHYMGEQLSLWQNTPNVIGSFFWNHRVLVGADGYFKEFSLLDLIAPKGPIPHVSEMDLGKLCPHQDLRRCPRYDPLKVSWNEECFWQPPGRNRSAAD